MASEIASGKAPGRAAYSPLEVQQPGDDDDLPPPYAAMVVPTAPLSEMMPASAALVEIRAPSDLPGGYELSVSTQGKDGKKEFLVQVPEGGVKTGQVFKGLVVSMVQDSAASGIRGNYGTRISERMNIPEGAWRDGLCDCCVHGPLHPHLWCALCCSVCALGQVLTRMELNACADPISGRISAFKILLFLLIAFVAVEAVLISLVCMEIQSKDRDGAMIFVMAIRLFEITFALFLIWTGAKTRKRIRHKYDIPPNCCEMEDTCLAWFCSSCSVAQMARHTAEYDKYPAGCCTETGLEEVDSNEQVSPVSNIV